VLCGKGAVDLPVEHGCMPDVDPAEVAAQPRRSFNDLIDGVGPEVAP
jgi:hypothetical protein